MSSEAAPRGKRYTDLGLDDMPTAAKGSLRLWLTRALLVILLLIFSAAVLGLSYQAMATQADSERFPPPGRLVDVGGYRLHIHCVGEGGPTVILDALFPGGVSNWAWIQPDIAKSTQVCSYDRAGLGWSDTGPEPRDAVQQAEELHTLLVNAGVGGPYVLVGHSLGGLSVRMFADLYPDETAGMVLVEGTDPDSWERQGLPEGVGVDRTQLAVAPMLAKLGIFRAGLIPSYASDPDLPPQQRDELQAFFNSAKSFETILAVDASFSAALDQVRQAKGLGDKPLAIVLGSNGDGSNEALKPLFQQQAALSGNSLTRIVDGATHAGLADNRAAASVTSGVIRQVVDAVRKGGPLVSTEP
jgi:pimeloyl-ACP methyl ester carboxylesterase